MISAGDSLYLALKGPAAYPAHTRLLTKGGRALPDITASSGTTPPRFRTHKAGDGARAFEAPAMALSA